MARRTLRIFVPGERAIAVRCLAAAIVLAATGTMRPAAAQPGANDAAADALFDEGVALRNAGDRAGACSRFRQSYRLAAARGTLLNIAECFEAEGLMASAWATYRTLADEAEAAGDRERLAIAQAKRAELEPRLASLTLVASGAAAEVEVRRDGSRVPHETFGERIPVDAGVHLIEVTAPGRGTWSTRVEVADGTTHRIEIPAAETLPVTLPPARLGPPPPAPAPARRRHPRATAGMVMIAGGSVSAAIGLGFGVAAWRAGSDADPQCDDALMCTPYGAERMEDARRLAGRADLLVGVGAAVAVAGAVLWWTAPDGAELTVAPTVGPGAVGVTIGGRL